MKRSILSLILICFISPTFACSLSGEMAASALRIKAIMEKLNIETKIRDQHVMSIKQVEGTPLEKFKVEVGDDDHCQIITYMTKIHPSCAVEVRQIERVDCKK